MTDSDQFSAERLAKEFENALIRHVIRPWFPRSIDREFGGFLCDFDRSWNPCGPNEKLLEFQARQTWFAAEASQFFSENEHLRDAVKQGFAYLRGALWDEVSGGWFHRLDRAGKPIEHYTKHAHGIAYAISACVAVHEATCDQAALQLAREGFEWLDHHAHDDEHGGYFGHLHRDGTVFGEDGKDRRVQKDSLGTPAVCKDINVHSDLLESLTYLYRAWPERRVAQRLAEVVDIVCNRMTSPLGAHFHYCLANWTPVPHLTRFGYQLQSSFRLIAAARLLGDHEEALLSAKRLADHALRFGWDYERGGFYYAGPGLDPDQLEGHSLVVRKKLWWVQVEALKALLAIHLIAPDERRYLESFKAQWCYIQERLIDPAFDGFYWASLEDLTWWRPRAAFVSLTRKGSDWKDCSHEGRVFLYCMSVLQDWKLVHSQAYQPTP